MPKLTRTGTKIGAQLERPKKTPAEVQENKASESKYLLIESLIFGFSFAIVEAVIIALIAVWLDYLPDEEAEHDVAALYGNFKDVNVMIFFGFGFLMTFLRRYGYSAIGYTLLISSFVCQWSLLLEAFFFELDESHDFNNTRHVGIESILNGLFCSGAVMISFGAVLGKVTPLQMLVLGIVEPFFFWLNIFICSLKLEAIDIGGGYYIHMFGAYFGMALTRFLTSADTKSHPDNCSNYTSDIFSLAGTLFLWLYWPSFNAVIAAPGIDQLRAIINTFLSLTGATISSFVISRLLCNLKFEPVHVQNSTLAGGVVMGIAAHLDITIAGAIGSGVIAGAVSVLGYRFLTPALNNYLGLQDVCGVHNLHGIPGILGAILSIFVTLGLSQNSSYDFPKGTNQPLIQFAALGITLGIAIGAGLATGFLLYLVKFIHPILQEDYFNDRTFWILPSDYEHVVREGEDEELVNPL